MIGTIPNLLKNAIITPIIKNLILTHQNSQITDLYLNYLYYLKFLKNGLYSHYLSENMLFDIRQNAFRKLHSTETIVFYLFDDLYNSLDTGKPIHLILLELSSAFVTLRHDILL